MSRWWIVLAVSIALSPAATAQSEWTPEQQEAFLLEAEVTNLEKVGIGTTGSLVATLRQGEIERKAGVQTVDIFLKKFLTESVVEFNFKDTWKFNVAGYLVDRLIKLNMVPVTVERRIQGKPASVSMWVNDVKMDGTEFVDGGHEATASSLVVDQRDQARVFQQLIQNTDPNLGNWLLDEADRMWLIDFSRAFRTSKELGNPATLRRIGEGLLENLRSLDPELTGKQLKRYLDGPEVKALLKRAQAMVEHFDARIEAVGADAVLIRRDGF